MKKERKQVGMVQKILNIRRKLGELYVSNPKEYRKRLENRKNEMLKAEKKK